MQRGLWFLLLKRGLSSVFYGCGWCSDVTWRDRKQEQQRWVLESPGSVVRWVQHHLGRRSRCESRCSELAEPQCQAQPTPRAALCCGTSFSTAWKGFGFCCNSPPPFCTNINHWGAASELLNWTNCTETLPSHFLFQVQFGNSLCLGKSSSTSPVLHSLFFSESLIQKSGQTENRRAKGRVAAPRIQAQEISASLSAVLALILHNPLQQEHVHTAANWKINVVFYFKIISFFVF